MASENDPVEATSSCYDGTSFIITRRRWLHVIDRHSELRDIMSEMLSTATTPDEIFTDERGTLHLVKSLRHEVSDFLVVIARKTDSKTYLVTAYFMNSERKNRRYRRFKKLQLS